MMLRFAGILYFKELFNNYSFAAYEKLLHDLCSHFFAETFGQGTVKGVVEQVLVDIVKRKSELMNKEFPLFYALGEVVSCLSDIWSTFQNGHTKSSNNSEAEQKEFEARLDITLATIDDMLEPLPRMIAMCLWYYEVAVAEFAYITGMEREEVLRIYDDAISSIKSKVLSQFDCDADVVENWF